MIKKAMNITFAERNKLISLITFFVTILFVIICNSTAVHAAGNPYDKYATDTSGYWANCTYWAWQMAKDNTGVELPRWGDAGTWYDSARAAGFLVGSTPKAKSLIVYNNGGYGHVGYVSDYNSSSNQIFIKEGGYRYSNNGYHEGWISVYGSYNGTPKGFIYLENPEPSPTGPIVDINTGVYSIHSALNNNLVVDIADGSKKSGANVQTYDYHGGAAQRFNIIKQNDGYYYIKPQCSNLFLDTKDNSTVSGANIQQCGNTGAHGQHWEFVDAGGGYYYIRSWLGRYLDVTDGKNAKQVNIQSCRYFGGAAQKWKLVEETRDVSEGYYSIVSATNPSFALDIANAAQTNGANLQLYKYNNSTRAQVFHITKTGGKYIISPLCSGRRIDTADNSAVSGANIMQWESTGAKGQYWKFVITSDDNYYIRSTLGNYIDITDGIFKNGTNIQSCRFFGGKAQKWKLVKASLSKFKPAVPQTKISKGSGTVTIKWTSVDNNYKNTYDVKIYNNATGTGSTYKAASGITSTSYSTNLPKGTYSVTVRAIDVIDPAIKSDVKVLAFQVDEFGNVTCLSHTWNLGIITKRATTLETGIKTYTCRICGLEKTETIPKVDIAPGMDMDDLNDFLTHRKNDSDPKGSSFSHLRLSVKKVAKSSQIIKWSKDSKADKYLVYGNKCGKTRKLKLIKKTTSTQFKHKRLKKGTYYKYIVVSVSNGKVVNISKMVHSATTGGKVGNYKTVKQVIKKKQVTLREGKTTKYKVKTVKSSKKVKVHRKLKFESSNSNVAVVDSKGIITGNNIGTCYIYAYAQNGKYSKIKVVVK